MTICAQCKHLYTVAKSDPWWRWLCMEAPLPAWTNHVTGQTVADPPYQRCSKINFGDCPMYEEGFNSQSPKEKDSA